MRKLAVNLKARCQSADPFELGPDPADVLALIGEVKAAESRLAAAEEQLRRIEFFPVFVSRDAAADLLSVKEIAREARLELTKPEGGRS